MPPRPSRNIGDTSLRAPRRRGDPMKAFDALPPPLRIWLTQAALPWSAQSAKRVWTRARAQGLSEEAALQALTQAETRTLARDRHARP